MWGVYLWAAWCGLREGETGRRGDGGTGGGVHETKDALLALEVEQRVEDGQSKRPRLRQVNRAGIPSDHMHQSAYNKPGHDAVHIPF